jgi:hypothetical protein
MSELERILAAVEAPSREAFRCAGRTVDVKPGQMLKSLQEFLYWGCYAKQFDGSFPERNAGPGDPEPETVEALRAAHAGRACRETAWVVEQSLENGQIIARKGQAVRRFDPGHYLNLDSAMGRPQKDCRVAVCHPKESTAAQKSWYLAFGEAVGDSDDSDGIVRFYWNISAEGAPELLTLLTRTLDRFQIPFSFKVPVWREGYGRRDAGVLYVSRRYYDVAAMLLEDVRERIAGHLDPQTPLFTKKLADGLGFAENPAGKPGESFGQNRCGILAQALVNAGEKGLARAEDKMEELNEEFRRRGLSPERPWLNPPLGVSVPREYEFPAVRD